MKRVLLAIFAFVASLFGATRLNLIDVKPSAGPTLYLLAVSTGSWIQVIPDPQGSISIDTSVTPAILKSPPSLILIPTEVDDDFTAAQGQTVFTTVAVPKSRVHVHRNGMLQRTVFGDYTQATDASGRVVVTIPNTLTGDGVTLSYAK